jgi:hypothetical protein
MNLTNSMSIHNAVAVGFEKILSKPWLGNATTRELLNEIAARVDLNYRTVGKDKLTVAPGAEQVPL